MEKEIVFFDVGARFGEVHILPMDFHQARPQKPYLNFMKKVGFEPDPKECERLHASGYYDHVFPNAAAEKDGEGNLYLTAEPACASMYEPDIQVCHDAFDGIYDYKFVIQEIVPVKTRSLDSVVTEIGLYPDWVKLDTQGAEQDILDGAQEAIKDSTVIIAELSSLALYKGQNLVYETIEFLAERGFHPITCNYRSDCPHERDFIFLRNFNTLKTYRNFLSALMVLSLFRLDRDKKVLIDMMKEKLSEEECLRILDVLAACENGDA